MAKEKFQLYMVGFGQPDLNSYTNKKLIVAANSFEEAEIKALEHMTLKTIKDTPAILDYDGSLKFSKEDEEIKIKSIEKIAEELIW